MKEELIQFLSGFPELSVEEVNVIAENIPVVSHPKGTVLLEEGQVPNECYFVLKGLIREYRMLDGEEKTVEFYTETNGAISSSDYVNQTASNGYLMCMEDSLLICGNPRVDAVNYKNFPVLKAITSKMLETDLNETKEKFSKFITSSPKDRYLNLLKTRPDLLNRVPLHQIASYLGMTAESLSRIRKRVLFEE